MKSLTNRQKEEVEAIVWLMRSELDALESHLSKCGVVYDSLVDYFQPRILDYAKEMNSFIKQ